MDVGSPVKRLSQALFHLVMAFAKQFTDHKMSVLPMRANCKHVSRIMNTLLKMLQLSPIVSYSSSLNW